MVESINAVIELMRHELGRYFPSQRALEVNLFVQFVNLDDRWMKNPIPAFRKNLYKIRQIVNMKFELGVYGK